MKFDAMMAKVPQPEPGTSDQPSHWGCVDRLAKDQEREEKEIQANPVPFAVTQAWIEAKREEIKRSAANIEWDQIPLGTNIKVHEWIALLDAAGKALDRNVHHPTAYKLDRAWVERALTAAEVANPAWEMPAMFDTMEAILDLASYGIREKSIALRVIDRFIDCTIQMTHPLLEALRREIAQHEFLECRR